MELKRIALGEFVDDLGIEEKVYGLLKIEEYDEDEIVGGYSKFGSPDLFSSLGPTFYATLSMFILILLIALLIIYIGRRSKLSEKN